MRERVHLPIADQAGSTGGAAPIAGGAAPIAGAAIATGGAAPTAGASVDATNGGGEPPAARKRRHPEWIRVPLPTKPTFFEVKQMVGELKLNTVCESASCPNIGECWSRRALTIMILGDICTRSCRFCDVTTGRPLPPDPDDTWSTIALMAVCWLPPRCAKSRPYQPIQSQQPLPFGKEPLADVARLVLSVRVCGNSTTMRLVSAQRE